MQIRCQNCHRPFALSAEVMRAALDTMAAQHLEHYFNVPCPHCHKLTRVPRTDLLHAVPDWKEPAAGETTE
jgi:hypothetical protein